MRVYAGTSGYSYKEWKGTFYPADLPGAGMLAHYAERLPAVEINNTFYRVPKRQVVEGWRAEVPAHFRFVLKATQRITHKKRLRDAGEELEYMLAQFAGMEERLGAVLYQLPPNAKQDLERLETFLALLPASPRSAFEFRHASWYDEATYELLRARNCALVASDSDEEGGVLVPTADWTYLRLRRESYAEDELAAWAERLRAGLWREAFVFFKHEDAGAGPRIAARFLELFA